MKADPYHGDSIIQLARLQLAEGYRNDAINTIKSGKLHILSRRDRQLLDIEQLRLLANPNKIDELDVLEKYLRTPHTEQQTLTTEKDAENLSRYIDERLDILTTQIPLSHVP